MLAKIHGSRHFNSRRFTAKYAGSICQKKNPKNVDTWNKKNTDCSDPPGYERSMHFAN